MKRFLLTNTKYILYSKAHDEYNLIFICQFMIDKLEIVKDAVNKS